VTVLGGPEPSLTNPLETWPLDPPKRSSITVHHDEDLGVILVVRRTQRARHEYTCCECGKPIAKGEVYRYEWNVCDGDGVTQRSHLGFCYDDA